MRIDESVGRTLGARVADALAAMKARCPGLDTVTLTARSAGGLSIPGTAASGMRILTLRAVGWSPSLHQCDIDARIVHARAVDGDRAAEDLVIARVAHVLARQRARADALANLIEVEALEWPGLQDLRDEYGDVVRARLRPLPRRTVQLSTIDHLHVDSALVHACRLADKDVHLTAALALQDMLKGATCGGGWEMSHAGQNGRRISVIEADPADPSKPPAEDPGDRIDGEIDQALVASAVGHPNRVAAPEADRHLAFEIAVGSATVLGDRVIVPGTLPQTALHHLAGRALGDLVSIHPAIDARTIVEAAASIGEDGPVTVARLAPDPWPLADADDVPRRD